MARPVSFSKRRPARHETPKPPAVKAKSKLGPVCANAIEFISTPGGLEKGGGQEVRRGSYWPTAKEQALPTSIWSMTPSGGYIPPSTCS